MDFDSSSKFISSLAKFLQSLCNGYVEFNSGVEVIGHIYLNVDTGKKIDYILNEKVCKTDENSVTFISNSFHAQPAERPKPAQKGVSDSLTVTSVTSDTRADDEEIVIMEEPESKNVGTLPSRERLHRKNISPYSKVGRPAKRPHSQSFSSINKHLPKQYKSDPPSGSNGAQHDVETSHTDNPSSMGSTQLSNETSLTAATDSDISHLSKVFPQTFNETSNNQSTHEERDIKPQLDSDMNIVQVKQEITHTEQGGEEDQEIYDESQDQSVFPSMPYDQYYTDGNRRSQRAEYGSGGLPHEFFQGNAGPSGEGVGDTSAVHSHFSKIGGGKLSLNLQGINSNTNYCIPCGKAFCGKKDYDGHMNTRHYGLRPHKCLHCGKSFAYQQSLRRHSILCREPEGIVTFSKGKNKKLCL
ncbi:hypothetical protein Btru_043695 [Bulinus truncatus]|nr:hypothetical protein Btru_043695 [Bulinus truncatus]